MNKYVKYAASFAAVAVYLLVLRYVAPSDKPYFILGIGIVGLIAWLLGSIHGLITVIALIPLTNLVYQQFSISTSYASFASSPAYLGIQILGSIVFGYLGRKNSELSRKDTELKEANARLQTILSQVKELGGIHNLCSECKSIQNDEGSWQTIDLYLKDQTKMEFSHCMCPECAELYIKQAETIPKKSA